MTGLSSATRAVELRDCTLSDADALRSLRQDVEAQAFLMSHPERRVGGDDTEAWIKRRLDEENGAFLAITEGHACVGFVQLDTVHRADRHARFAIGLDRSVRGEGVGQIAMTHLLAHAVARDLRKLWCEVRADNVGAYALYGRLGFVDVGRFRAHYHDGEQFHDVVVMERLLDDVGSAA